MKDEIKKQIEQSSENFGLTNKEKTIFEISSNDKNGDKKLVLKSGSWQGDEPWFGIDENGGLHTMVSLSMLSNLVSLYKIAARENFNLKLEKSILQRIPIDFGDVWIVCMDEIKKVAKKNQNMNTLNINFDAVVEKVKSEHPNLFVDIENLIKKDNK